MRLKIQRDRVIKIIRLNQKIYLRKILKNFNMIELKKANNLMNFDFVLESTSSDFKVENFDKIQYQLIVSFLMYFMLKTRSNITFLISQISRFSSNSTFAH